MGRLIRVVIATAPSGILAAHLFEFSDWPYWGFLFGMIWYGWVIGNA